MIAKSMCKSSAFPLFRVLPVVLLCLLSLNSLTAGAKGPSRPDPSTAFIVGEEKAVLARYEDTFADLAEAHGLGFNEMVQANPGIDPWLPGEGTEVVLPGRHIVPSGPRQGLLINLSEFRMYYFAKPGQPPLTFPIGIGTLEFPTPLVETSVTVKAEKPTWYPPASIRARHLKEEGVPMPAKVPPGPENPLGPYAMRLALDSYLIHGTNKRFGIGMAVSHGCIRMNNSDIAKLFKMVPVGTPVRIVREPVKVALKNGLLWAEVHPDETLPLSDLIQSLSSQVQGWSMVQSALRVDDGAVRRVIREQSGRPEVIGRVLESSQVAINGL